MDPRLREAQVLDENDTLRHFRSKFHFPTNYDNIIYLNGNSLGLQPKNVEEFVLKEIQDWKKYGVEGHFIGDTPWLSYHELLAPTLTRLLGAKSHEVVIMNSLTVNLHLMMVSFYKPTATKYKILVEYSPFPSDLYALKSQLRFHGHDPADALIELKPDHGEVVSKDQLTKVIDENKDELALIMIGGVNYYTGQTYDMEYIGILASKYNITYGLDLAHAAGNIKLDLHDWNVDFAVFCTYKYLNSGPGSVGGCYVHEKHARAEHQRFAGWWGHDKETRFMMPDDFVPIFGVESWQLSNPPILSLAAIRASFEIFDEANFDSLMEKRNKLIAYARKLLQRIGNKINILTPDEELSGAQLSIEVLVNAKAVHSNLIENGVICDWREPNVIRVSFVPLYNSFGDIFHFVDKLTAELNKS